MDPTVVTITDWSNLVDAVQNSIDGHTAAMTALNTTINDIYSQLLIIGVVLVIVVLAYWHRDRMLYLMAGAGSLAVTINYFLYGNWYLTFIFLLFSVYSFIKGFIDRRPEHG